MLPFDPLDAENSTQGGPPTSRSNSGKLSTSMPDTELKRHLQSLACGKFRILKKHPPGRNVQESDSFSFNHDFTCPMQKIKIGTVSAKVETTEERKETRERIDEERQHQMEVRDDHGWSLSPFVC